MSRQVRLANLFSLKTLWSDGVYAMTNVWCGCHNQRWEVQKLCYFAHVDFSCLYFTWVCPFLTQPWREDTDWMCTMCGEECTTCDEARTTCAALLLVYSTWAAFTHYKCLIWHDFNFKPHNVKQFLDIFIISPRVVFVWKLPWISSGLQTCTAVIAYHSSLPLYHQITSSWM